MVDIKYEGSGSIESLKYRYCPETPTPLIKIVKYAGPPGKCDPNGVGSLEDVLYTVPSESDSWVYCYEISVPPESEECLFDVQFQDPAPIGGTPNGGFVDVTMPNTRLCPGDTPKYFQGPIRLGEVAPEGPIDAKVVGVGQYSGTEVFDEDPAKVDVIADIITPPTPAPSSPGQCPFVTLNFTSIPNPMADLYGQTEFFKGGDYLYDQLWWTYGVKVSARVKSNNHRSRDDPFIPKYKPGLGWVDDKVNSNTNDPSSGGAVRLFDTLRPTHNSANPQFSNPVCTPNNSGDGDPDLGAPNRHCTVPGPGKFWPLPCS